MKMKSILSLVSILMLLVIGHPAQAHQSISEPKDVYAVTKNERFGKLSVETGKELGEVKLVLVEPTHMFKKVKALVWTNVDKKDKKEVELLFEQKENHYAVLLKQADFETGNEQFFVELEVERDQADKVVSEVYDFKWEQGQPLTSEEPTTNTTIEPTTWLSSTTTSTVIEPSTSSTTSEGTSFISNSSLSSLFSTTGKSTTTTSTTLPNVKKSSSTKKSKLEDDEERTSKGTIKVVNHNYHVGSFDILVYPRVGTNLKTVKVPVWTEEKDQDDLRWYVAKRQADGSYKVTVEKKNHKNGTGTYHIHLYYEYTNAPEEGIAATTTTLKVVASGKLSIANKHAKAGTFDIYVSGISASKPLQTVQVSVWTEDQGKDDIRWYTAVRQADGRYRVQINKKNHKNGVGTYRIDLYYIYKDKTKQWVNYTRTVLPPSEVGHLSIANKHAKAGTFDIYVSNSWGPKPLQTVQVSVWTEDQGKDDIRWYTAVRQADGRYRVQINKKNHKNGTGTYRIDLYYTYTDKTKQWVNYNRTVLPAPPSEATITVKQTNAQLGQFEVVVTGIGPEQDISKVWVPVWSDRNGQDDVKWYIANKQADGSYKLLVKAENHKYDTGVYHIHVYADRKDGKRTFHRGTKTQVTIQQTQATGTITIKNINQADGIFDVIVSNFFVPDGVEKVEIPIWSEVDGQDDIVWYVATLQPNGHYKLTVNMKDHRYSNGLYHAHLYYRNKHGELKGLSGTTATINRAKPLPFGQGYGLKGSIFIDPGHGGLDSGAFYGGVKEKDLALTVSNSLRNKLERAGYRVLMSRTGDQYVDFRTERSRMANQSGADIFISIHFNASGRGYTDTSGIETYWYKYDPEYQPKINMAKHNDPTRLALSERLANSVQSNVIANTGAFNRGVKRETLAVLRETSIPAILTELGFMDNPLELAKLKDAAYQERLSQGLFKGVQAFYGGSTTPPPSQQPNPNTGSGSGKTLKLQGLSAQKKKFIEAIQPGVKASSKETGILSSIIAAQAILESGWGTSKLATSPYHNLFGIKADASWKGTSALFDTKEFVNGKFVTQKARFRTYSSWALSIRDHGKFFSSTPWRTQHYRAVRNAKDYRSAAQALQAAGYATDPGYAKKLQGVIESYGLDAWD